MSAGGSDGTTRVDSDLGKLAPLFRAAVEDAIQRCHDAGLDAMVYEAYRSLELARLYYARGRTVRPPLTTVTNAPDNTYSWHGYGLAVDVISRSKGWDAGNDWFARVAEIFKACGCRWGGEWKSPDLPHFQWGRCRPSPSDEARRLLATQGAAAVWAAVAAMDPKAQPPQVAPPAPQVAPSRFGVVTADRLNLRSAPAATGDALALLPQGARVEVLDSSGDWFRVKADGQEGFVKGDYVSLRAETFDPRFLVADENLRAVSLVPAAPIGGAPEAGAQHEVADAWNRYGGLLEPLAGRIQVPPAAAVAILCVESSGNGFDANGRMIIRFENHVFHRLWGKQNPDAFAKHFRFDADKPWTGHQFAGDDGVFRPCHQGQNNEWQVFEYACSLDRGAATASISMGAPQIMGFNHDAIGYVSAEAMFDAFKGDARFQLLGMFDFIRGAGGASSMVQALQQANYESFATRYNGSGQAPVYGGRIRERVEAFQALMQPA